MSSSETPARCEASIASPMIRASSWLSQTPVTVGFSPIGGVGEQRLAEPPLIVGDEPGRDREDVPARAVVALEPDHLRAGEVALEAQDVVHVRAAPAVDRLVVVADAAQVPARLRQQPEPQVLDDVGVLVLVDQDVAEAPLEGGQHVRILAEEPQRLEQKVAEVDRVQGLEPRLIGLVERDRLAAGEGGRLAGRRRASGRGRGSSSRRPGSPAPGRASACRRGSRPAGPA